MPKRFDRERVDFVGPAEYRIIVDGELEAGMSDYLAGMELRLTRRRDGTVLTTLTGRLVDQAELNGVMNAIYEMHLPILVVEALESESEPFLSQQGK
jgi:hypothetical protein